LTQAAAAQVAATTKNWLGPYVDEAWSAYHLARGARMTALRARVWGHIGSNKITYAFRRTIAKAEGCSIRTVQRAITEGQDKGIGRAVRSKPGQIIPGLGKPLTCGCSLKWVAAWGRALGEKLERIAKYRLRRLAKRTAMAAVVVAATAASAAAVKRSSSWDLERDAQGHVTPTRAHERPPGTSALDWINAELARLPRDGPE
jgi:hypothetical protein